MGYRQGLGVFNIEILLFSPQSLIALTHSHSCKGAIVWMFWIYETSLQNYKFHIN